MRSKHALDHAGVGPEGRHELGPTDHSAGLIHELDQDVERASTDLDRLAIPLETPRRGKQPKRPKRGNLARALIDTVQLTPRQWSRLNDQMFNVVEMGVNAFFDNA